MITLLMTTTPMAAETDQPAGSTGTVKLTPAQIQQAGITTKKIQRQSRSQAIEAPGVVAFNAYALADITTLVDSVVHQRHVHLGDHVKKGQKLVTLNSTALAQAEAAYLQAKAEHHRSKQELARLTSLAQQKIISQARLQQADSNEQTAHAKLAAAKASLFSYGLGKHEISGLLKQNQYGLLTLRAPHAGTVIADDFRLGQHLAAGSRLMQVIDESYVWVEVKIPESQLSRIRRGQTATVLLKSDDQQYSAHVINIHHQLDPATRTAGVRLQVRNSGDALHPGMFVQAGIATGSDGDALFLPERAVQRQDNKTIVFIRNQSGDFVRRVIRVGKPAGGFVPVFYGVKADETVVVGGSFSLISELMKSSFADED
jgi:RND family efflux transporter MFP subunit